MGEENKMREMLFGEYLGKVVQLSSHDVAEIMEHQSATRQKFGEIALAWGLCRPQHVWQAWWGQLQGETPHVDLTKIGVDAQSVGQFPIALAVEFRAVPLRSYRDQLVVATTSIGLARAKAELPAALAGKQVRFVVADVAQIDGAIATYYPSTVRSAGAA